jgi:hypothetical protein
MRANLRLLHRSNVQKALGAFVVVVVCLPLAAAEPPGEERVETLARHLTGQPERLAPTCDDRSVWNQLAQRDDFQAVVRQAERLLDEPLPEQSDELFLDYSQTGNRTRWQRVAWERRGRIKTLALAECVENEGRFLPTLAAVVRAVCAERTWVYPAHDRGLRNFKGEQIDIDLGSAYLGAELAFAHHLLGEKLSPEVRRLIEQRVRERILAPFRAMVTGERSANWWLTTTNNWNSVCLAGVTGAALALVEEPRERAFYVAAAESYSRNFLRGFTADGYCSEGLAYWNYGFGHYAQLAELVRRATGGELDLLAVEGAQEPVRFGRQSEIVGGVHIAFSDCPFGTRPDPRLLSYLDCRLGGAEQSDRHYRGNPRSGSLARAIAFGFAECAQGRAATGDDGDQPLRTWFQDAGVLICRPHRESEPSFGVALKGGHNAEHHNQNDVGSFIVVVGDQAVLVDPGTEVYTARTFSRQRYESDVLNSYGHPVPVVAGQLQRTGREARGQVLRQSFTNAADTIVFDLSSAYDVPSLERLQRAFRYDRTAGGQLTVTDTVAFSEPQPFETALITFGDWQQLTPNRLRISDGGHAVDIEIDASGAALKIRAETIDEDVRGPGKPTRIGIAFAEPLRDAELTVQITPVAEEKEP